MESRSNFKPDLPRIGIASSIAAQNNYDWEMTFRYAQDLNVDTLQLYLSLDEEQMNRCAQWLSDPGCISLYLHLPPEIKDFSWIDSILSPFHSRIKAVIQHERRITSKLVRWAEYRHIPMGIENDNQKLDKGYFDWIKLQNEQGRRVKAVLDVARFYHQWTEMGHKEIWQHVESVINLCRDYRIPIIYHVIDIQNRNTGRDNWTKLGEGIIPWKKILKQTLESGAVLEAIIFEFEDVENTRLSLEVIRAWLSAGTI